jgi:hypothetical protein
MCSQQKVLLERNNSNKNNNNPLVILSIVEEKIAGNSVWARDDGPSTARWVKNHGPFILFAHHTPVLTNFFLYV